MNLYEKIQALETEKSSIYNRFLQIEAELRVMYAAKDVYESMKSNPELQEVISGLLSRNGIPNENIQAVFVDSDALSNPISDTTTIPTDISPVSESPTIPNGESENPSVADA
jgi:hypothetical protein